jgi:hypothetical protein
MDGDQVTAIITIAAVMIALSAKNGAASKIRGAGGVPQSDVIVSEL